MLVNVDWVNRTKAKDGRTIYETVNGPTGEAVHDGIAGSSSCKRRFSPGFYVTAGEC